MLKEMGTQLVLKKKKIKCDFILAFIGPLDSKE